MSRLVSINPANNEVVGEVEITSHAEITNKVTQAHKVKNQWKDMGVLKRAEILKPLIDLFKKRKKDLAMLTTREMGKPVSQSLGGFDWELNYVEHFLADAPKYLQEIKTVENKTELHRVVFEPRGVAACIAPWNYPFSNIVWGVIPNLLAGNTVVSKNSELCPLFGKLFEEIMMDLKGMPAGVFSQIHGAKAEGEFLVQQNIDLIWFTGSSTVGKKLFEVAAKKQIKAVLEMGGSNPAVIFEDVDVDYVITNVALKRFGNCGQICDATKRLIVHHSRFDEVAEKLAQHVSQMKLGDPELDFTEIGPLASMQQLELLEAQVNKSIAAGAKVVTGGSRPKHLSQGAYYQPTILTNITFDMPVWHEEVFGPVLPIVSFKSEEEAIQLANDTIYGLGSSVYSKDLARARRVANQIEAGCVEINGASHWNPSSPFGGYKASGMGTEHGRWGFEELCRIKIIAE